MIAKPSEARRGRGRKESAEKEECKCPMRDLVEAFDQWSDETFGVFKQTRIELLKGIRTLIDRKIEDLESGGPSKRKARVSKIEIEE